MGNYTVGQWKIQDVEQALCLGISFHSKLFFSRVGTTKVQTDHCQGLLCCPCLSELESAASEFVIYAVHPGVRVVMAVPWRLVRTPARALFLVSFTCSCGCHSEDTDTAASGNPIGAQSRGRDTGGKVSGQVAMELREDHCCLRKTLDGAREQVQRNA